MSSALVCLSLAAMVRELLLREGYQSVETAGTCIEAMKRYERKQYQLVLLDVMLPDGDGFALFEKLQRHAAVPVIFVSARDEDSARLRGLGLGADDYVTKPFLPQELLLRMKAVLKRTYRIEETVPKTKIGEALIDWSAGTVETSKGTVPLTAKEYTLLRKLCDNRGCILSIDALCDTLWSEGNYGYENSLMVHIRRLREKIEPNPSKPMYLVTVRGLGYKLQKET